MVSFLFFSESRWLPLKLLVKVALSLFPGQLSGNVRWLFAFGV